MCEKIDTVSERIALTPDSYLIKNFIEYDVISSLEREINFAGIHSVNHRPKSVFQADTHFNVDNEKDSYYYLRCPSIIPNQLSSMVPIVRKIRDRLEEITGVATMRPVHCNIAKILKYQGNNQLKNHADKIIDLKEKSNIYTIRFGANRCILLKNKIDDREIIVEIPHNSLFVLGHQTNQEWTHGIPPCNTPGATYSIVLRESVTYLHKKTLKVWGPRTKYPTVDLMLENLNDPTINAQPPEIYQRWHIENKFPVELDHYSFFF